MGFNCKTTEYVIESDSKPKIAQKQEVSRMNDSLATELLKEVKQSAKRWFYAFCIVTLMWFSTIGLFLWYISLPIEEETTTQELVSDESSDINQVGGDYDESKTDKDKEEKSNEK